jgi:hypothetical protein
MIKIWLFKNKIVFSYFDDACHIKRVHLIIHFDTCSSDFLFSLTELNN